MAILFDKTMPEPNNRNQDLVVRRNGDLHLHPKVAGRQAADVALKQAFAVLGADKSTTSRSKK